VRGAELTISPVYRAAQGLVTQQPECGLSLRFPRFEHVRDDKAVQDATTNRQIADMFALQRQPVPLEEGMAEEEDIDDLGMDF
jgi:DNA ligase 1